MEVLIIILFFLEFDLFLVLLLGEFLVIFVIYSKELVFESWFIFLEMSYFVFFSVVFFFVFIEI